MHYAQVELDRIKTHVRPQQQQVKPDPIQVLESAYHMTMLDAQNEVYMENNGKTRVKINRKKIIGYRRFYNSLYSHSMSRRIKDCKLGRLWNICNTEK